MLKTIFIAATALTLSSVAQADTVKQIWNQEIGAGNPGRVESAGECMQDDSSSFGCWNDSRESDVDAGGAASPADPPPNGGENGGTNGGTNGDGPTDAG